MWCAVDKQLAFAKQIPPSEALESGCEQDILAMQTVASKIGVFATPSFVFENGDIKPGYISPDRLLKLLDK